MLVRAYADDIATVHKNYTEDIPILLPVFALLQRTMGLILNIPKSTQTAQEHRVK